MFMIPGHKLVNTSLNGYCGEHGIKRNGFNPLNTKLAMSSFKWLWLIWFQIHHPKYLTRSWKIFCTSSVMCVYPVESHEHYNTHGLSQSLMSYYGEITLHTWLDKKHCSSVCCHQHSQFSSFCSSQTPNKLPIVCYRSIIYYHRSTVILAWIGNYINYEIQNNSASKGLNF